MQWFIDIIKEWVQAQAYATMAWVQAQGYLTTGFVDRGDVASSDMGVGDFWKDGQWHTIELSSIVPEGAKAVLFYFAIRSTAVAKKVYFRTHDNAHAFNVSAVRQTVANVVMQQDMVCPIDWARRIEYRVDSGTWSTISFTVKGWWF